MSISPCSSFQLECPVTKRPTVVVNPSTYEKAESCGFSTPMTSSRKSTIPNASDILFEQPMLMSPPIVQRRQPRVAPLRLQLHCLEVSLSLPKLGNMILGDNTFLDPTTSTANNNMPASSSETVSSDVTISTTTSSTTTPVHPTSFKDSHTAGPIRWVATCQSGALYEISRTHLEPPQLPTATSTNDVAKSLNLSPKSGGGSNVSCGLTQIGDTTDTGESDSDVQPFAELMPHNTRIHYDSSISKAPKRRADIVNNVGGNVSVSKRSLADPTTIFPVVCKASLYTPCHQPLQRIVCGTMSIFSVPAPTRGATPTSPTSPISPTNSFVGGGGGSQEDEEDSNPLGMERVRREYQSKSPLRLEHLPQSPLMHSKKMLLVLDLDETLAHALRPPHEYPNNVAPWTSESYDARLVFVREGQAFDEEVSKIVFARYRPFLREFLGALASHFQIAIFTASRQLYADALLDVMDPSGRVFPKSHRYYRHHCTTVINRPTVEVFAGGGIDPKSTSFRGKDLRIFGRPLNEVVLLDNTVSCGYLQPRNLLPIPTWTGDASDSALLHLIPVLKAVAQERDVYGVLERHLGSHAETPLYTPSERANIAL